MLIRKKSREKNAIRILDGYLDHANTLCTEADFSVDRKDNEAYLRLNETAVRVISQLGTLRGYASDSYFMGGKNLSREYVKKIDNACDDLHKKCLTQRLFGK